MAQTATFVSKFTNHILVRRPKAQQPLPTGGWSTVQQRTEYVFEPGIDSETGEKVGRLTVRKGQDKLIDHDGWLRPGEPEYDEKDQPITRDAVDALMAHREFGQDFWIEGHAPGTLYPRPQDWTADVIAATAALDEGTLVEMIRAEQKSHARVNLLREAEAALKAVREQREQIEVAEQAKAAAKPKAKAPAAA